MFISVIMLGPIYVADVPFFTFVEFLFIISVFCGIVLTWISVSCFHELFSWSLRLIQMVSCCVGISAVLWLTVGVVGISGPESSSVKMMMAVLVYVSYEALQQYWE